MSRKVYTLLLRLLSPLLLGWMWWRARGDRRAWQVFSPQRFGCSAPGVDRAPGSVWVHAVSLGETRAAQPLVDALLLHGCRVLLTHMTATGRDEGGRLFAQAIAEGRLRQAWLPYDFPGATRRFLACHRPRVGVLIEREVWPNLLHAAEAAQVPMALVSARMSARSSQRTARTGGVMHAAYQSLRLVCAQTEEDAQRLRHAGARHVRVTGNFKFDVSLPSAQLAQGRAFAQSLGIPVIAIASTREGEDAGFIQALQQQRTLALLERNDLLGRVLFLLIPRHPRRFDEAAGQLAQAAIPFLRWSQLRDQPDAAAQCRTQALVLLGDTLGDMAHHYAASRVAIVAGSFGPFGGQNLIEACAAGAPVIVGPQTWNFAQAVEDAVARGAAQQAPDAGQALQAALDLLACPAQRQAMADAGLAWVQAHAGAVERVVAALQAMGSLAVDSGTLDSDCHETVT